MYIPFFEKNRPKWEDKDKFRCDVQKVYWDIS